MVTLVSLSQVDNYQAACSRCAHATQNTLFLLTIVHSLGEAPSLFQLLWYLPTTSALRRLETLAFEMLLARSKDSSADKDLATSIVGLVNVLNTAFLSDIVA